MNIYQLLQVCYMHGRRYPHFEVYTEQVIIATSLEKAEEGMRKHIEKGRRLDNIYAFYIREIPVDRPAVGIECLSERVSWRRRKMGLGGIVADGLDGNVRVDVFCV